MAFLAFRSGAKARLKSEWTNGHDLDERAALETYASPSPSVSLMHHFVNAVVEGTDEPSSWAGNGLLPTHVDGLQQARVSLAIERSARDGEPVSLA